MAFPKKTEAAASPTEPKTIKFELLNQNTQTNKIASKDIIFDDKTEKIRKIELRIGASTIFSDEMEEFEHELPLENLTFWNRVLEIDSKAQNTLDFLRLTDQNAEKANRLGHKKNPIMKEIKPLANIQAKRAKLELMNKAETLATTCKDEEMLPFAHVLGIDTSEDPEFVRVDFIEVARIRPDYFIKYFSDPLNEKQFLIGKALRQVVIVVDGGMARYTAGNKAIVEVPADENPETFLAKYCGTESGKAFYESIKKLVE